MENSEKRLVESIRAGYEQKSVEQTKIDNLKYLDEKARRPAEIFAFTFGTAGALVLGTGMCMAMQVIFDLVPLGIVIGCAGIAMVAANYFIYRAILKSRKKKYAGQILELSGELLNK